MRWGGSVDIVAPITFIVKLTPWYSICVGRTRPPRKSIESLMVNKFGGHAAPPLVRHTLDVEWKDGAAHACSYIHILGTKNLSSKKLDSLRWLAYVGHV